MKTNITRGQENSQKVTAPNRYVFFIYSSSAPFELAINLEVFKKRKGEQVKEKNKRINRNKGMKSRR